MISNFFLCNIQKIRKFRNEVNNNLTHALESLDESSIAFKKTLNKHLESKNLE